MDVTAPTPQPEGAIPWRRVSTRHFKTFTQISTAAVGVSGSGVCALFFV